MSTTPTSQHDCWSLVEAIAPHSDRLLLWGPPSFGKTHFAVKQVTQDRPVYNITFTEDTPAVELRGHFVAQGGNQDLGKALLEALNKPGATMSSTLQLLAPLIAAYASSGGGFRWMHGPGIAAWISGGTLIANEIGRASLDTLSLFLVLADDPLIASLTLPTGETVRPKPGFRIVATTNDPPSSLPEALRSRFPVSININKPHEQAIQMLPNDLQAAARLSCVIEEEERRIDLRAWKAFAHLRQRVEEEIAAATIFGTRALDIMQSLKLART